MTEAIVWAGADRSDWSWWCGRHRGPDPSTQWAGLAALLTLSRPVVAPSADDVFREELRRELAPLVRQALARRPECAGVSA
ncbi:hypothetical protein J4H86_02475 [Spiractinospora alimapuensis]|uniref:hypothetical protein n=1 Tax=Spiractinospora alimapuensis TaxID=2820884 RepID=UPI001F3BEA1D|nr:hypothetical protein [Spiractinospora alimapuensis]QVQ52714.1 hypothetical protein J4H86_02475 [Spiractinospora alimapuensis]